MRAPLETTFRHDAVVVSLLDRCRKLRRDATDAERLLWSLLRGRQLAGAKFRRHHQFGRYVLDFCCPEHRLVIEIDGGQHVEPGRAVADRSRSAFLKACGLRVLRFTNLEVWRDTESVLETIWLALQGALTPTLSQRERE